VVPLPTELRPWILNVQRPGVRRLSFMRIEFGPALKCLLNSTYPLRFSLRGQMFPVTVAPVDTLNLMRVPGFVHVLDLTAQNRPGSALRLVTLGTSVSAPPAPPTSTTTNSNAAAALAQAIRRPKRVSVQPLLPIREGTGRSAPGQSDAYDGYGLLTLWSLVVSSLSLIITSPVPAL